jgi:glycosyltransferase involved in cell wall biosynthesis
MKVALVLATSTGGIGRHVRMLADGFTAQGVTVEIFGPLQTDRDFALGGGPGPGATGTPVRFTAVEIADRPRPLRDLRAIVKLRRLLGSSEPDAVHAHGLRAGALTAVAVVFTPAPRRGALIVTVHNAPPVGGVIGAIYRGLEVMVARRADSVLCVSADLEERMRAVGARRVGHAVVPAPSSSLAVAPGDVSAETRAAVRAELGAAPDRPVVLAVGRLAPQKGFGLLLDAAACWRDARPEPLLVMVGEGPLEAELKDRAAALGLAVRFAGHRKDVPALLAAADVFVLPSVWEGQALILQEALRAGVPIVATRVGGNPELAGEDAAVLVPPGDAARFAAAVRVVLGDPALAARLRKAALEQARELPDTDQAVAAALAEYRRVLRHPGAHR